MDGEGPWGLPDGSDDCEIIFTPGHTEAHCVLYYKPQKVESSFRSMIDFTFQICSICLLMLHILPLTHCASADCCLLQSFAPSTSRRNVSYHQIPTIQGLHLRYPASYLWSHQDRRVFDSHQLNTSALISESHIMLPCEQVLFSADHLAADCVGEWNSEHEANDDGFLGITRNFNCGSSIFCWCLSGMWESMCEECRAVSWYMHPSPLQNQVWTSLWCCCLDKARREHGHRMSCDPEIHV